MLNTVIATRQSGINGIPVVHSNVFIHISNSSSGNITITHISIKVKNSAISLSMNFILLPAIKFDAVFNACFG